MYGFVFWQDDKKTTQLFIDSYIKTHKRINPFTDLGIVYSTQQIGNYVVITFQPENQDALPILTTYSSDEYFILFYGILFDVKSNNAEYVSKLLYEGKPIVNLNGNYSIILFDKHQDRVSLLCDFIGRRKLYYYHSSHSLVISNLDHMLSPFLEHIIYDEVCLTSSLYFDWSIQGRSFLKGVKTTNPDYILHFYKDREEREKVYYPLNQKNVRLEDIETEFQRYLEGCIQNNKEIHFDLTAGLDTRTVLALLLSLDTLCAKMSLDTFRH